MNKPVHLTPTTYTERHRCCFGGTLPFLFHLIILCGGLISCGGYHIRSLQKMEKSSSYKDLSEILLDSPHSYVRLASIESLQKSLTHWQEDDIVVQNLQKSISSTTEKCYIKAQVAYTLGQIHYEPAVEHIIQALHACDDESRYWMVISLLELASISEVAKGELYSLSHDSDIFISNSVQSWLP